MEAPIVFIAGVIVGVVVHTFWESFDGYMQQDLGRRMDVLAKKRLEEKDKN